MKQSNFPKIKERLDKTKNKVEDYLKELGI